MQVEYRGGAGCSTTVDADSCSAVWASGAGEPADISIAGTSDTLGGGATEWQCHHGATPRTSERY